MASCKAGFSRACCHAEHCEPFKAAWAPAPVDYGYWSERLSVKKPFVAIIDHRVAGFIELEADGYIDCTYTHPDFQGRGVVSGLYAYLLAEAQRRGLQRLYVEASLVAKPFFEHRGFSVISKNEVQRHGVSLVNFLMERYLV
ncbi:MAG: GNAT family N-acetyltransferase [Thiolinea sp.]